MAAVLCGSQDDDDVGGVSFVDFGLFADLAGDTNDRERHPCDCDGQGYYDEFYPFHALCWAFRNIVPVSGQTLVSEKNPLLRDVRRAAGRGALTDGGFALAEGPHLLEEAVRSGVEIGAVIVVEGRAGSPPQAEGLPHILHVSEAVFKGLSTSDTPQGVLTLVRLPTWTLEQVVVNNSLLVVLDGVQDPGNAGAIVRASEAFGASGVIFLKGSVGPHNSKCMRGSAGSIFRVPLVAGVEAEEFLGLGLRLYAADPRGSRSIAEADLKSPCALVVGSEGRGVSDALTAAATGVRIPTANVESLNAAVAAGILLYEARRQRGFA